MGQKPISNASHNHREIDPQSEQSGGYEDLAQLREDNHHTLSVLVDGVHCAACIQKIESALGRSEDIKSARLNFGAKRLFMEWEGPAQRADDFVQIVENLGYRVKPYDTRSAEETAQTEERFLLLCLGVAGFAMGNVMLLSVGVWSTSAETMGMATRDFFHWISAAIALPTILFSGRPFFRSALSVLTKGHTNMDVPISLAIVLAGSMSLFETVNHGEHVYFDSAIMLIFFLLIGRYLDFRARKNARGAAHDLLQSFSGFANVIEGDKTRRVLIRDLKEDMIIRVAVGEKFPVDGVVISGQSHVDTALVTGESVPVQVTTQDEVYAGTLNLDAPLTVRVAKAAQDSLLSDIVRLMDKAQQGQAAYVRLADRAAKLYTPVVHTVAAISFCGWFFLGGLGWQPSLMIAVTVLIITCPCALGLAVPVVQVLASSRMMKRGILVKSGDALERMASIDTIMLDKTGTLTLGTLRLIGEYNPQELKLAASLASQSAHPLSKALIKAYNGELLELENVSEHAGQGLSAEFQGKKIKLGSRSFCGDETVSATDYNELWLQNGETITCFCFEDKLRTDAPQVIELFKSAGVTSILVSGDRQHLVEKIAQLTAIEKTYAQMKPTQKYEILEALKTDGHTVLMVGDGLNDAPVLAGANVSMAPGTAIDMAQNAADIIFMGEDFMPVYDAYHTAKFSQTLIRQNFAMAVIYNIVAIPLAVCGMVTPLIAALAMSGSSLLVIANSFRLRLRA